MHRIINTWRMCFGNLLVHAAQTLGYCWCCLWTGLQCSTTARERLMSSRSLAPPQSQGPTPPCPEAPHHSLQTQCPGRGHPVGLIARVPITWTLRFRRTSVWHSPPAWQLVNTPGNENLNLIHMGWYGGLQKDGHSQRANICDKICFYETWRW